MLQHLDISAVDLQLPNYLARFPRLTDLSLVSTRTRSFPAAVGRLRHLTRLRLGSAEATKLPYSLWSARRLGELQLHVSQLKELLEEVEELKGLTHLDLGTSEHCDATSASASGWYQPLEELVMEGCTEEDFSLDPEHASNLRRMSVLSCPELQCVSFKWTSLQHLMSLTVHDCKDFTFRTLPGALRELRISHCNGREAMEGIVGLSNLQVLEMRVVQSYEVFPKSFKRLTNLRRLLLENTCFSRLPDLRAFTLVTSLELRDLLISKIPVGLGRMRSLQTLVIHGCRDLNSLPDTLQGLSSLTSLDIAECGWLRELPRSIGKIPALETLELKKLWRLKALPGTLGNLRRLRSMWIDACPHLLGLPDGLSGLSSLVWLKLSRLPKLSAVPLCLLQLTVLRELCVEKCENVEASQMQPSGGAVGKLLVVDLSTYSSQ